MLTENQTLTSTAQMRTYAAR